MSAQPERPTPELQSTTDDPVPGGVAAFLRHFLVLQVLFLVFLLIASIPEPPSPASPVSASIQVAAFAVIWGLTDLAAVTVQTVKALARRAGHAAPLQR